MVAKELVFELSELKDLKLGFVCPKCGSETVCTLNDETPFHKCPKDNNPYPNEKGQEILRAFRVAFLNIMELESVVRLRLTIAE